LKNSRHEPEEGEGENTKPNEEMLLLEHAPSQPVSLFIHVPFLTMLQLDPPFFPPAVLDSLPPASQRSAFISTLISPFLILFLHSFNFHLGPHKVTLAFYK